MKLVCLGTKCGCDNGIAILPVIGKSCVSAEQLILLDNSKIVGNFGICKILTQQSGGNPVPCIKAIIPDWKEKCKIIEIEGKNPLLEKSYLECTVGGKITLIPNKSNIEVNE